MNCHSCGKVIASVEPDIIHFCDISCANHWADRLSRIILKFRGVEQEKE